MERRPQTEAANGDSHSGGRMLFRTSRGSVPRERGSGKRARRTCDMVRAVTDTIPS